MGKTSPRESIYPQNVVQELGEFVNIGTSALHFHRLLNRRQVRTNLMRATPGRADDVVVSREIRDEQLFGGRRLAMATGIDHWLPAAGLVERIVDGAAQSLQELEGRDPDLRLEGIHVAGDEEADVIHNARSTEIDLSVRLFLPVPLVPRRPEDARAEHVAACQSEPIVLDFARVGAASPSPCRGVHAFDLGDGDMSR